jgi:hypothetical protein
MVITRFMQIVPALFIAGISCSVSSFAQDSASFIGKADCKLAPLQIGTAIGLNWNGQCKDGYAHGIGMVTWRDASGVKYKLEANMLAGVIQGLANMTLDNGNKYSGTFKDGVQDGKGYFELADGMQYEGDVRQGRRTGQGEGVYPNGDRYVGEWIDGKPHGKGHMWYMLGGEYDGEWHSGVRHGKGSLTYAGSGRRYEGMFMSGRIEGAPALQNQTATYAIKTDEPSTGSLLKVRTSTGHVIPPERSYADLSQEQRHQLNAMYPALEDGDEPPYPLNGTAEFYKVVPYLNGQFKEAGRASIRVLVNATGKVDSVAVLGTLSPDFKRTIGTAAGLVKYKPAVCRGTPCTMMFFFDMQLQARALN